LIDDSSIIKRARERKNKCEWARWKRIIKIVWAMKWSAYKTMK
jgi:hypothetical protein